MPVIIPNDLPAAEILASENIFTITEFRAVHQDIRPLRIGILNLMPTKSSTETQILRLLGNTPLQIEIVLIKMETHECKNTPADHLERFYQNFSDLKNSNFDGLIITGAPVEELDFEQVDYWDELAEIMTWSLEHVYSTFHICWGAQAGLFHHYGIEKHGLEHKQFGVFPHKIVSKNCPLLRGMDDTLNIPHSRHTEILAEDIRKVDQLQIVALSDEAGPALIVSKDGRQVFATGHSEYSPHTLKYEYERDLLKGVNIRIPENYYPSDNPDNEPEVNWRSHAHLLFSNWLNYYVYQATPYELEKIKR